MAIRDVYSEAEKRMLEAEAKRFEGMAGWYQPRRPLVATVDSIRRVGLGVDPWNPLWHDEDYGRGTSWGSILAYPTFLGFFGETGIRQLEAPPECGQQYMIWMGEDYEFTHPTRPGDSFRIYQRQPQIFDVTPADGRGPRVYGLLEGDLECYDHDEQPVGRLMNYVQRTFLFEPPKVHAMPEYTYTEEEIRHLGRLMSEEEVRGATARYWEDVHIGDELRPIVTGPTNMGTNALTSAITPDLGGFFTHARDFYLASLGERLGPEFIRDPAGGRYMVRGGLMSRHWSDQAAQAEGEPCAWLFGIVSRFALLRVITNWMGDDGFLRRFKWRHMTRTRVGDAIVAGAKVVGKRIEGGEHLVDLHVWLRNLRGNVSEAAVATVRLPSRELASAGSTHALRAEAAGVPVAFKVGDQVRVKAQPDWPAPPGFRFAGAEGAVVRWVEYDEAMADFADSVVCVRIDSAHGEGQAYVGSPLFFRLEDVEHVPVGAA